jgi:hypothetical protein
MTWLWPQGQPIAVVANNRAEPLEFRWRGHTHRVADITRHWRVDLDWWQGRVWRDYFKLSADSGLLVIVYRDLTENQWYLQRLYD